MLGIFKKVANWQLLAILVWAFITFLVISQPAYTTDLNLGSKADISYKNHSSPANASTDAVDPYTIPVVLKAEQQAVLSSMMDGYIESILVKEGDIVKKGQALVEFNCKIQQAQYEKGVAQVEEAKAAHSANVRLQKLGAISDPEVEKSKFALAEATADFNVKRELVDYCSINAPFDGTIVKINAKAYQTVNRNAEILELIDNEKLRLELIAPSNWLGWINPGYKFKIDIVEINKTFPATVTKILPKIDAVSQTVRIIAHLDRETDKLIAGMNGKAYFSR